jgi:hypothetical protein
LPASPEPEPIEYDRRMEPASESDLLALRLAECAVRRIDADPDTLLPRFIDAVRELRTTNGPKKPYDSMELAALEGWDSLRTLLLARSDEGDLVRSMAPLLAVVPQEERSRAIRDLQI